MALFALIVLAFCVPRILSVPEVNSKVRRSVEEVDNDRDNAIIKYIQSIDLIHFSSDVILVQSIDTINGKTQYRQANSQISDKIAYETNSVDADKDVIILKAGEDHIKSIYAKRVFVVLRRTLDVVNKDLYYVSYLYIKPALPADKLTRTLGKQQFTFEWDFWDHRDADESEGRRLESAFECSKTIFVPCRSNETFDFPLIERGKALYGDDHEKTLEGKSDKELIIEGGDADIKMDDYYSDIVKHMEKGFQKDTFNSVANIQTEEGPYLKYGWLSDPEMQQARKKGVFIGFGSCRLRRVTLADFDKAVKTVDVIRLYQTALRTQCVSKDTKLYEQMLEDGIILLNNDKTFQINTNTSFLTREKLKHQQRIELYRGLEIGIFSQVYMAQLKGHSSRSGKAPDGSKISKSASTLGKMYLQGLSMKHKFPTKHFIKVMRNCVKSLRRAMDKLVEDEAFISVGYKGTNLNDRVYLTGLITFIMHGLSMTMHGNDIIPSFNKFFINNREVLEHNAIAFY